ncbi:[FeFe] hydrogenase H-cluster radical SAM maturase HydG [Acidaminobacter sp. JC074]|uniref:[FeFe] hydrogenase H-cluster radical SAM maturase HydG n=1 Tax=Acidaminobacter sp. JC074 TaxID=2530199 RepID=UPI001F0EAA8C|nr:[FeFe] hydrogenase H-cluster radical SAM maturase HydG [Acidaminobacter sp. JC074]MCH4889561.1 [FeFe] hydrogenase H-cluster radical SAM maturase HydG [Acidaminobacter sp. JC074]
MFINHDYIEDILEQGKETSMDEIHEILKKARSKQGLTHLEVAKLIQTDTEEANEAIFKIAGEIKQEIYGNRVVIFAPLYVSNYCVNSCTYCGYGRDNDFKRRKLTDAEIQEEVKLLESMGHKRIALEVGEDPVNCDIDYVCHAIDTIYATENKNGNIRRINVNIAATTVEEYKMLKEREIGTYILFQETYHKPTYEQVHPKCLKGDYDYHLTAFDRAMQADIDDVGGGVLFGLADYKFELMGLMLHNDHLEEAFGVGFHTISVPRLQKAEGMNLSDYPNLVTDDEFKRIVAIIRLAVPFTGIILSTRESAGMRKEVLNYGVSQVSAGSCTGVGGYKEEAEFGKKVDQFEVADHRTPLEIIKELLRDGFIPSYCTACYRSGRTGDRFMRLAKSGQIHNVCQPNALMTLQEFALDYGDTELKELVENVINKEVVNIGKANIKELTQVNLEKIKNGERDLYV